MCAHCSYAEASLCSTLYFLSCLHVFFLEANVSSPCGFTTIYLKYTLPYSFGASPTTKKKALEIPGHGRPSQHQSLIVLRMKLYVWQVYRYLQDHTLKQNKLTIRQTSILTCWSRIFQTPCVSGAPGQLSIWPVWCSSLCSTPMRPEPAPFTAWGSETEPKVGTLLPKCE